VIGANTPTTNHQRQNGVFEHTNERTADRSNLGNVEAVTVTAISLTRTSLPSLSSLWLVVVEGNGSGWWSSWNERGCDSGCGGVWRWMSSWATDSACKTHPMTPIATLAVKQDGTSILPG